MECQGFTDFLRVNRSLYNFLFTLDLIVKDFEYSGYSHKRGRSKPRVGHIIKNLDVYVSFEERLQLRSIEYRSPGSINFQGAGGIIRELREWLERWFTEEGRKKRQHEVKKEELDIIEREIEILRRLGYNELEIRELMGFPHEKCKAIEGLIKEGKLKIPKE